MAVASEDRTAGAYSALDSYLALPELGRWTTYSMPPRKGIVKSGNAGNSSKAPSQPTDDPTEKPLFPSGSKFPLSLLHER